VAIRLGLPKREKQQQQQQEQQAQQPQSGQPSKQRWNAGEVMRSSGASAAAVCGSATQGTRDTVDQQVREQQQEAQLPTKGQQPVEQGQAQQHPSSRPSSGGRRPASAADGGGAGQQAGGSTAVVAQVQEPAGTAVSLAEDGGTEVRRTVTATARRDGRLGFDGEPFDNPCCAAFCLSICQLVCTAVLLLCPTHVCTLHSLGFLA
jgi:hypothetical protein